MRKIIPILFVLASVAMLTSCADTYMVETVYGRPYYYSYQEPYSRLIISSMPPRHYRHRPHVEYRHYRPHHHAMPPSRPLPPSDKPHRR